MKHPVLANSRPPAAQDTVRKLARFRYELRQFLRFSEKSARAAGITPQQHQLLLGVAGYTGRGWATISELAEFLQERHNAVVGLVERASRGGLVRKAAMARDHRFVRVELTQRGKQLLARLAQLHRKELARFQARTGPALEPLIATKDGEAETGAQDRPGSAAGCRGVRAGAGQYVEACEESNERFADRPTYGGKLPIARARKAAPLATF
jgi:DNA-binding MarR family transcriptional regulator